MANETVIRDRPIAFTAGMVKALLEGRKTQTRRIIPNEARGADRVIWVDGGQLVPTRPGDRGYTGWVAQVDKLNGLHLPLTCRYGMPGDRLWVQEDHHIGGLREVINPEFGPPDVQCYYSDGTSRGVRLTEAEAVKVRARKLDPHRQLPARFMLRSLSRLSLELTAVRAQRLQDIVDDDAQAEGVMAGATPSEVAELHRNGTVKAGIMPPPLKREVFRHLWNSIHFVSCHWDSNPWVWAITFKVLPAEVAHV